MAQILNNMLANLYQSRLKKAETRLAFLENFLPIKLNSLNQKHNDKLIKLELKKNNDLLPHLIVANVEHVAKSNEYEAKLKAIEETYYWKEREIKQTCKRENIDSKDLLNEMNSHKKIEVDALNLGFNPVGLTKNDKEIALKTINEFEKNYNQKVKELTDKHLLKVKNFTEKTQAQIKKQTELVKQHSEKLSNIVIDNNDISLEDGVLLKLDELSMHFGGLKAVDKLSFEVKEGEIFGLIGPNGAGKTTVFNCITRFYKPTSGDMFFKNKLSKNVDLNDIVVHNIIKEGIVRTFQNVEMIWELNVIENLLVAAHTEYRSGFFGHLLNSRQLRHEEVIMRAKAMKILEDLDLTQYAYYYPMGLPYGILKKIELARTLMVNPKLIILDEPAAGLNDTETAQLAKTIKKIKKDYNTTIFLVEHDMGLVMDICDTVCAISFGKKLAIGTPKEIQNSKIVREAYLGGE